MKLEMSQVQPVLMVLPRDRSGLAGLHRKSIYLNYKAIEDKKKNFNKKDLSIQQNKARKVCVLVPKVGLNLSFQIRS